MHVNDFSAALKPRYSEDLNRRLTRFDQKTGYGIYIVFIAGDQNQSLDALAGKMFELNELERRGSAGTVLLLIAPKNGQVAIATSKNLRGKIFGITSRKQHSEYAGASSDCDRIYFGKSVTQDLGPDKPWFYRLDPPSVYIDFPFIRRPTAEKILFPLAPFLGVMTGIALMAFTSAGDLRGIGISPAARTEA